jgi:hypothetical protein
MKCLKVARKSGLDAKAFLTEVNTNLGKVSGFGFKSGVLVYKIWLNKQNY